MDDREVVRQGLESFLGMRVGQYFDSAEINRFFREMTTAQSRIEGDEVVSIQRCENVGDLAISSAIAKVLDDLGDWHQCIQSIRSEHEYQTYGADIKNYREVYGDECNRLESIRASVRLILTGFVQKQRWVTIDKADAAKRFGGISIKTLMRRIKDGVYQAEIVNKQSIRIAEKDLPQE